MEDTPGKRLKALREGLATRHGRPVSQAEVAEGSKVKLSSLQKWETDGQVPTGTNLLKIARYYGVPPEHIISGAPIPEATESARLLLQTAAELRAMADELERRAGMQPGPDEEPGTGEPTGSPPGGGPSASGRDALDRHLRRRQSPGGTGTDG